MAVNSGRLLVKEFLQRRTFSSAAALSSQVKLTSERYPNLKRGNFASLNDEDIKAFQAILEPGITKRGVGCDNMIC